MDFGKRKGKSRHKVKRKPVIKRKSISGNISSKSQPPEKTKTTKKKGTPKKKEISRKRLWLFRIIAITVIPVIFLFIGEILLRITGLGYDPSAIIKYKLNDKEIYCNNNKFGWSYFPKNISRESDGFVFEMPKEQNQYRIFILGASAARGEPDPAYSFSRILQVMLETQFEGFDFQVINISIAAINSHGILKIAKDCARFQPDLFVVYLGNNEVVGPYGAGTVFAPFSSNLAAIRTDIAIKTTRIGQLLQQLLDLLKKQEESYRRWKGLASFLENQVRFDSPELNYVYEHFERNLIDICEIAEKADAKIMLCNVGSNLKDCPPFASLHRSDITDSEQKIWDELYQKGIELENDENFAEALQVYLEAAEIDENYAELQFRTAECYLQLSDYQNAKDRYLRARDLDTLRLRADTKINEIIHFVTEGKIQKGIYFVDTMSAFENNSPFGLPGKELFFEHVHFNFKGNYLLAQTVYEQIEKVLPLKIIQAKNDRPIPSEKDCINSLAFTGWDQQRVIIAMLTGFISQPPFTNQLYHEKRVGEIEKQIESLVKYTQPEGLSESDVIYKNAIERRSYDWKLNFKYAEFLLHGLKNHNKAITQYHIVLQNLPYYIAFKNLGGILFNIGELDEAIEMYHRGLERKPTYELLHFNLALALEKKQNLKGAIKHFSKALQINPYTTVSTYHLIASVYIDNEKFNKAIQVLRKSLEIYPDNAYSHLRLGALYIDTGKKEEAIEELNTVLKLEPDNSIAQQLLDTLKNKE